MNSETTQHTHGPWQVSTRNGCHVQKYNDNRSSEFYGTTIMVANCDYQQTTVGGSKTANARLIAAAPELLTALIGLIQCDALFDASNKASATDYQAAYARNAIAKAGGKA